MTTTVSVHPKTRSIGVKDALLNAAKTIAPLWPLTSFVAVNPYFGHAGLGVSQAQNRLAQLVGARRFMDAPFYEQAVDDGLILDCDIDRAIETLAAPLTTDGVKASLYRGLKDSVALERLNTVSDVAAEVTGQDWSALIVERISHFASSYLDIGQATTATADKGQPFWAAWQDYARYDASLDLMGLRGARGAFARLPCDPVAATEKMLQEIGLAPTGWSLYLERLLRHVGGWAAFARQQDWPAELEGAKDLPTVTDLAAVRLAYDWVVHRYLAPRIADNWRHAGARYAQFQDQAAPVTSADVLQEALELSVRRRLTEQFQSEQSGVLRARPEVQAAFCIDVRSEIVRRAFEAVVPRSETLGFAGFFGFALGLRPLGAENEQAQCPVLLKPTHRIRECSDHSHGVTAEDRRLKARFRRAFKRFKNSAVGSFAFVEMFGLMYGARLVTDTLGLTAPAPLAARFGLEDRAAVSPLLTPQALDGAVFGIASEERLDMAETVLRAMSLTDNFARHILLVGHGSSSRNNPHAAGLDCGACGGYSGEVNARVAAKILNDPSVRSGLNDRGISIPRETIFLGAVHDTVTDQIALFEDGAVPPSGTAALADLREKLNEVARLSRRERAPLLHEDTDDHRARGVKDRGRDWAQVRPEWGLAGCASFVAAPRHRTNTQSLSGKAFLHSYDWRADTDFSVLELIMTAPMVVASWINLQYYASTIDNRVFGAGDKTLHNVVGRIGVLEGVSGDLRVGLPLQSVFDGERYVHTPTRLNVVLEAPMDAIGRVIERHDHVRDLLENGWIHLFHMDARGKISHSYDGAGQWRQLEDPAQAGTKDEAA